MTSPPVARRRFLADTTPLREVPAFRWLWIGQSLAGIGTQLTVVTVGLQVYALTSSTFSVGLVGVFALVPLVGLGLYGGALVDAHDRRRVALLASVVLWVVSLAIAAQAWWHVDSVELLYGLVAVQSAAFAVNNPARSAIVPGIVPRHLLPAANALSGTTNAIALTVGPLLAGFLVGGWGFQAAYTVDAVTFVAALAGVWRLPPMPPDAGEEVRRPGLRSVLEGIAFLGTRPNIRATFLADLCAMVFAMPRVLYPALGAVELGGGARTVGILGAGFAVGSVLAGLFSGRLGAVRRQGAFVVGCVVAYGAAVAAFGLVLVLAPDGADWKLWLCVVLLAASGAADAVSSIFRGTILQVATPDALRGRLQGVFIVVVAGGPRLGDLVLGSAADGIGEGFAALAGGAACVAGVLVLANRQRGFLRYDARHPTA
ncbi:MFS transporter [Kineococcus rhizosphaerae]|uniref:Putative MFS family arabinose efflux permease n=1 Tax=Kineococcus rhizosphaerae TaxID=559628 RepID=A0A2T0R7B5_9ACTN|nr:MFS transporter [Kineococcus rhizosphaerae]PRY17059.1 putative MFS family arabinose efflux permease [Kineococcus rhizosphaerae]